MKKISFVIVFLAISLLLSSCSISRGDKSVSDIEFKSYQCVVNALDGAKPSVDNEYRVITDYKAMTAFIAEVPQQFNTSKVYEGSKPNYSTYNFNRTTKKFDEEFFKSNDLIVIRRYHITEKPVEINSIDINNKNVVVNGTLETGGESVSFYRYYFISISNGYCSDKSTVELKTSSVEETTNEFTDSAFISKEYNYKLIKDLDYADNILSIINSYKLTKLETEIDTDSYELATDDIMFAHNGFSSIITSKFIIINDVQYQPNIELHSKLIEIYNQTQAEIHADERPVYETETQTSAS